jgi:hypothetical protein
VSRALIEEAREVKSFTKPAVTPPWQPPPAQVLLRSSCLLVNVFRRPFQQNGKIISRFFFTPHINDPSMLAGNMNEFLVSC